MVKAATHRVHLAGDQPAVPVDFTILPMPERVTKRTFRFS